MREQVARLPQALLLRFRSAEGRDTWLKMLQSAIYSNSSTASAAAVGEALGMGSDTGLLATDRAAHKQTDSRIVGHDEPGEAHGSDIGPAYDIPATAPGTGPGAATHAHDNATTALAELEKPSLYIMGSLDSLHIYVSGTVCLAV